MKKAAPKAQNGKLTKKELDALSHQKRGMGELSNSYVKKSGSIMNDIGYLTNSQKEQLKNYMSKTGTAKKIYEALPNVGRMLGHGNSAADIPKGSQLEKQRKGGVVKKKMRNGGAMLRQAPKSTMEKISSTKLKDVPAKAEKLGKKVIEKGKKLASDTVEKVKNTTVGDAAKAIANTTGPGMAYNLAKKFANSDIRKQIKEDLNPERLKKGLKNIKSNLGFKHGGKVSKMKNGGSLSALTASTKRDKGVDPKGAFTKVQKKTLKGAKGKASLTKDKQLGATKMKMGGKMKKC
jgi:hypothetical protein